MSIIGALIFLISAAPAFSGTPLDEVLRGMRGFGAVVGAGLFIAGALNAS